MAAFIAACLGRRPELDTAPGGNPATAAYIAAHAAGAVAEETGGSYREAHDAERAWQSAWFFEQLGLAATRA